MKMAAGANNDPRNGAKHRHTLYVELKGLGQAVLAVKTIAGSFA